MKKKGWQVVEHKSGHDGCWYVRVDVCKRERERERGEEEQVTCTARASRRIDRKTSCCAALPAVAEAETAGASALAVHRAALAR